MPLVIPVFIPHQGCPCHCLFCNQQTISGGQSRQEDDTALVRQAVTEWLGHSQPHQEVQVAFYGGSFTCLSLARQQALLDAVQPFIHAGEVHSIRLSTRPDCIDKEICDFLLEKGVKIVELGVQSLDNRVLQAAQRGHSGEESLAAARILKEKGMQLGIQLMPGLPEESSVSFLRTVQQVIALAPDFVRLYPTLVISGSGLAEEWRQGRYQAMGMNRAIGLCCRAKELFGQAGIEVVRMGLQASVSLEKEILAGPYHPAFGELVTSRLWFKRIRKVLASCPSEKRLRLRIPERDISAFVGMKRANMKRLQVLGLAGRLDLETDKHLQRGTMEYVIT